VALPTDQCRPLRDWQERRFRWHLKTHYLY